MQYCEDTSPTRDEAREIIFNLPVIKWPNHLTDERKRVCIENAMKNRDYKFGSWRGFYTFFLADIIHDVNAEIALTNQYIRGEAAGC
tara:strand:- start:311 stop:571 length:261 start_codon:yes stop_codon:yes gene_type:complete